MPRTSKSGIQCPGCKSFNLRVVSVRQKPGYVWRRRECQDCGERLTTTERPPGVGVASAIDVTLATASINHLLDAIGIGPLRSARPADPRLQRPAEETHADDIAKA